MILKDFFKKYSLVGSRVCCGDIFECEFDEGEGFIIPEGFCLLNNISIIPLFIVAVNRDINAIIRYDEELSLLIYDSKVQMDATIEEYEKEFKWRFENYLNFKYFCDSITTLGFMEVIDAISHEFSETDQIEESNKKKDTYMEDLMTLLRLFTFNTFPKNEVRANFISDAYFLLRKLESSLISVKSMNLVKIVDVDFTQTDETYYVLNNNYVGAYEYITDNMEQSKKLLLADEWRCIGKIDRWDNVLVETYKKDDEIIAIWDDIAKQ